MNWIQFSNKKEFSFITKCITKCSEILNVRYWWILIYFKTYSPTISLKPPLLKLSEWASGPNGRFWIIAPQLWTNHLPPSIEPMALNCHQRWICLFQFSGLPKWHQKDNMGSIDFSIIYQSHFEADCIIIGLRHFKSYIFWTTSKIQI